ncbi:MAG: hypothetical protein ACREV1_13310 [Gammaproteobacteria bacterium]
MSPSVTQRRMTAAPEARLSRHQMYAALAIARISAEEFERLIEGDNLPSVSKLITIGRKRINVSQRTPEQYIRALHAVRYVERVALTLAQTGWRAAWDGMTAKERARFLDAVSLILSWARRCVGFGSSSGTTAE